jgi:hypothetical protein
MEQDSLDDVEGWETALHAADSSQERAVNME